MSNTPEYWRERAALERHFAEKAEAAGMWVAAHSFRESEKECVLASLVAFATRFEAEAKDRAVPD